MDELPVMQRDDGERDRVVVVGKRTDDGSRCTVVVLRGIDRRWALYPHGASELGVWLSRDAAVTVAETILAGCAVSGSSLPAGVIHLLAADEVLGLGRWDTHVAVCGEDVRPSDLYAAAHECCLSCECVRYCPECVREAFRWSARCW